MNQVSLLAPEIHCDHCKTSIEGAVRALPGIAVVEVSVPDTKVEVSFDESLVDLDQIKTAIQEQGYAVFG